MTFLIKISTQGRTMKVHEVNGENRPVCGGGRGGRAVKAWQSDIGPANCKRCEQVLAMKIKRQSELVL